MAMSQFLRRCFFLSIFGPRTRLVLLSNLLLLTVVYTCYHLLWREGQSLSECE